MERHKDRVFVRYRRTYVLNNVLYKDIYPLVSDRVEPKNIV